MWLWSPCSLIMLLLWLDRRRRLPMLGGVLVVDSWFGSPFVPEVNLGIVVGQTVFFISSKTHADNCHCAIELCTASMVVSMQLTQTTSDFMPSFRLGGYLMSY